MFLQAASEESEIFGLNRQTNKTEATYENPHPSNPIVRRSGWRHLDVHARLYAGPDLHLGSAGLGAGLPNLPEHRSVSLAQQQPLEPVVANERKLRQYGPSRFPAKQLESGTAHRGL